MSCIAELSVLQCVLLMKCLPMHSEKLNVVLMCVKPLMVPIMRSTGHIRNFVRSTF